jgi:hypothetical protein
VKRLLATTSVRGPNTPAPRMAMRFSGVCVSLISVPCTVINTRAGVRHLESATGMKNGQSAAWTTSYRSPRTPRRASMIFRGRSRIE